jgi:anti-sigma B factor antagonist
MIHPDQATGRGAEEGGLPQRARGTASESVMGRYSEQDHQGSPVQHQAGTFVSVAVTTFEEGIGLLEPDGKLVGGKNADDLRHAADRLAEQNIAKLIVDLGNVSFMDSSGLGALVSIHAMYHRKNWAVVLCGVRPQILSVLTVAHLSMIFEVCETRDQARAKFQA